MNFTNALRSINFLFGAIIMFSGAQIMNGQVHKMVIVEEFTNASCPPCASQNPAFNELLKQNKATVIGIKYQTQFPGFDPYNVQNNPDVLDRSDLYEITGVPTAFIDGVLPDANYGGGIGKWATEGWYPGAPGGFNQDVMNYAAEQETTIGISIEANWNEDLSVADVYVQITNFGTEPVEGQFWVPVMLVELENQWLFAPGNNNETHFTQVMRRIYPEIGLPLLNYLAPGATTVFEYEDLQIPSYIYDLKEMAFVTFLQDPFSRQILNGAITEIPQIPATFSDLAILEKRTVFSGEECGKMAHLGMLIENAGETDIHSFSTVFEFGNETHRFDHEVFLSPGDTILLQSPEPVILPSGTHQIAYSIEKVNGDTLREINVLNNMVPDDPFTAIAIRDVETFDLGFEGDKAGAVFSDQVQLVSQNNLFIRISDKSMFPNVNTAIGGYGLSEKSVFVNFRQWNPASFNKKGSIILVDNADISGASDVEIIFDLAHAQRDRSGTLSEDVLEAWVSYDCGQNWSIVYRKSGSQLATAAPVADRFFPSAEQWITESIILNDLSEETLMFRFELESDNGNSLFLDNFLMIKHITGTENTLQGQQLEVFPNPSSDRVIITFDQSQLQQAELNIYTLEGKHVKNLIPQKLLAAGQYRFEWQAGFPGMYIVSLNNGKQVINKKITVIK